jgi:hypothetical protein
MRSSAHFDIERMTPPWMMSPSVRLNAANSLSSNGTNSDLHRKKPPMVISVRTLVKVKPVPQGQIKQLVKQKAIVAITDSVFRHATLDGRPIE